MPVKYSICDISTNDYLLVYSCEQFDNHGIENVWIYSRQKTLSNLDIDELKAKLKLRGVDITGLNQTLQNCD